MANNQSYTSLAEMQRCAQQNQYDLDNTPKHKYAIIAAVDKCGGIGKNGVLPWSNSRDMQHFKQLTTNNICVMGKSTYVEINNSTKDGNSDVLPNRKCFVVSSTLKQADVKNATVISSIYDVDAYLTDEDLGKTVFYIGGYNVFKEALSRVQRVYLTIIDEIYECDRYFPTVELDRLFKPVAKSVTIDKTETPHIVFVEYLNKYS